MADPIDFALDGIAFQRCQRQGEEETDPSIQNCESFEEGTFNLFLRADDCGGVRNTPSRCQKMSGPNRAYFVGSPVAHGEYEMHLGSIRLCELVPTLAAQPISWHAGAPYLLQGVGMHAPGRIAPCTVGGEVPASFVIQNGFGHYGSRRIAGTEEQDVEMK